MTAVRHTNGDYLKSTSVPTLTGDWVFAGWYKSPAANYGGGAPERVPVYFGTDFNNGTDQAILLDIGAVNFTTLAVVLFTGGGASLNQANILTGSDTAWTFIAIQHVSGSTTYTVRWRKESDIVFQSTSVTVGTQLTTSNSFYIGSDPFAEHSLDSDARSFFVQATTLSDAALMMVSQFLDRAPSGTNLHWLDLDSDVNAGVNGGTAGNWTVTGTLQTDAAQPLDNFTAKLAYGGIYGGTTDASTAVSDPTVAPTQTVSASGNNRGLFALVTGVTVSTGVTSCTFNSVAGTKLTSQLTGTNDAEVWWWNDAALPAGAGTYSAAITVDGATGTAAATLHYMEGVSQSAPTNFGVATGTGTSITASLASNATAGSVMTGVLVDLTVGDSAVDGANQLQVSAVNGTSTGNTHRHTTSAKYVPTSGANSMSWSGLTNATAKIALVVEVLAAAAGGLGAQPLEPPALVRAINNRRTVPFVDVVTLALPIGRQLDQPVVRPVVVRRALPGAELVPPAFALGKITEAAAPAVAAQAQRPRLPSAGEAVPALASATVRALDATVVAPVRRQRAAGVNQDELVPLGLAPTTSWIPGGDGGFAMGRSPAIVAFDDEATLLPLTQSLGAMPPETLAPARPRPLARSPAVAELVPLPPLVPLVTALIAPALRVAARLPEAQAPVLALPIGAFPLLAELGVIRTQPNRPSAETPPLALSVGAFPLADTIGVIRTSPLRPKAELTPPALPIGPFPLTPDPIVARSRVQVPVADPAVPPLQVGAQPLADAPLPYRPNRTLQPVAAMPLASTGGPALLAWYDDSAGSFPRRLPTRFVPPTADLPPPGLVLGAFPLEPAMVGRARRPPFPTAPPDQAPPALAVALLPWIPQPPELPRQRPPTPFLLGAQDPAFPSFGAMPPELATILRAIAPRVSLPASMAPVPELVRGWYDDAPPLLRAAARRALLPVELGPVVPPPAVRVPEAAAIAQAARRIASLPLEPGAPLLALAPAVLLPWLDTQASILVVRRQPIPVFFGDQPAVLLSLQPLVVLPALGHAELAIVLVGFATIAVEPLE